MNKTPDIHETLGGLVAGNPARAAVLESLGLDFCCGGARTLAAACAEAGLDAATVARLLAAPPVAGAAAAAEPDLKAMPLTGLVDHIEATHHAWLRRELPSLQAQAAKVRAAHGPRHPELAEAAEVLAALAEELDAHLAKEEQILFPAIRALEGGGPGLPTCGGLQNPIRVMEMEHDEAGEALRRLRELTGGHQPPPDACATLRGWCAGLAALERDLHRHIHKENNVLFPRVLATIGEPEGVVETGF